MESGNLIVDKSFDFGIAVVSYAKTLNRDKEFIISNQLLRSGTSIGANVWEAQEPESKRDFVHKMKIALKEANETRYWLEICKTTRLDGEEVQKLLFSLEELKRIISKIVISSKM